MASKTLNIIALRTVKYNDRSSIVTAYSLEEGPVSLLVPAGNSREAARVRAITMPLSVIECQASSRHGMDIYRMSSPRPTVVTANILSDPDRRMIAQFLAEVLTVVLREGQSDRGVFEYIRQSVETLDSADRPANFHIAFLYGLAGVLGIAPDVESYTPGAVFDMIEGRYRVMRPLHRHFLDQADSAALHHISRMTFANMAHFHLSRDQRNNILDAILYYYTIHYASLASLRSLAVLRSLL